MTKFRRVFGGIRFAVIVAMRTGTKHDRFETEPILLSDLITDTGLTFVTALSCAALSSVPEPLSTGLSGQVH